MHAPGTLIGGRHRIEALLGQGGFGVVYRATQLALDRPVALKVLLPEALGDEALPRFQREAEIVQRLDHPNIVRLLDFGVGAGAEPYLVFELLQGQTLHEALASAGPLSVARAARVGAQILKALMEAHARGVVHRDIKPANVFLCNFQGEPDFVKVLDFGIAKGRDSGTLTGRGGVLGTPAYMAPEQANGGVVGFAADLFSLGLVLEEMLTGKAVYGGMSLVDIVREHVSASVVPHAPSALSSPLGPIIHRATSKRAELRYPSAGEMLAHLEAAMSYATASGQVAPSSTGATPPNIAHAPTAQPGAMVGYPSRVSTPGAPLVPAPPKVRSRQRGLPWKTLAAAGGGVVSIGALVAAVAALTGDRAPRSSRAVTAASAPAEGALRWGLTIEEGTLAEVSANADAAPDFVGFCTDVTGTGPASLCAVDGATFRLLWRRPLGVESAVLKHYKLGGSAGGVVLVDPKGIAHVHEAGSGREVSAHQIGARVYHVCAPSDLPGKVWLRTVDWRGLMIDTAAKTAREVRRPASCKLGYDETGCNHRARPLDPRVCPEQVPALPGSGDPISFYHHRAEGTVVVAIGTDSDDSSSQMLVGLDARDPAEEAVVRWQRSVAPGGRLDAIEPHHRELDLCAGRAVAAYTDIAGKTHLVAVDAVRGRTLWDTPIGKAKGLLLTAKRVYVGGLGRLEVYDAANGRSLGGFGATP